MEDDTAEEREAVARSLTLHKRLLNTIRMSMQDITTMSAQDLDVAITATSETLVYLLTACDDGCDRTKMVVNAITETVKGLVGPLDDCSI
jgi:hypothetical protein